MLLSKVNLILVRAKMAKALYTKLKACPRPLGCFLFQALPQAGAYK